MRISDWSSDVCSSDLVGGVVVAWAGVAAAFIAAAVCYLPLIVVMILWKRAREIPRLPPERLVEATIAGLRYVLHSPRIRTPLWRTFSAAFAGTAIAALLRSEERRVGKEGGRKVRVGWATYP